MEYDIYYIVFNICIYILHNKSLSQSNSSMTKMKYLFGQHVDVQLALLQPLLLYLDCTRAIKFRFYLEDNQSMKWDGKMCKTQSACVLHSFSLSHFFTFVDCFFFFYLTLMMMGLYNSAFPFRSHFRVVWKGWIRIRILLSIQKQILWQLTKSAVVRGRRLMGNVVQYNISA